MTAEQQRIAIAEACGWPDVAMRFIGDKDSIGFFDLCSGVVDRGGRVVPDFLNDLNAMHEAEKVLTKEQQWLTDELHWKFISELVTITKTEWTDVYSEVMKVAHATAAQRAEAFLRTIGKWEEAL